MIPISSQCSLLFPLCAVDRKEWNTHSISAALIWFSDPTCKVPLLFLSICNWNSTVLVQQLHKNPFCKRTWSNPLPQYPYFQERNTVICSRSNKRKLRLKEFLFIFSWNYHICIFFPLSFFIDCKVFSSEIIYLHILSK